MVCVFEMGKKSAQGKRMTNQEKRDQAALARNLAKIEARMAKERKFIAEGSIGCELCLRSGREIIKTQYPVELRGKSVAETLEPMREDLKPYCKGSDWNPNAQRVCIDCKNCLATEIYYDEH